MASATVDLLIRKIVSCLENEASLIGGVSEELNQLRLELESMTSFLKDANRKRALTEGEKIWVDNVRDTAYEVEDILDDYTYHTNKRPMRGKFKRLLHRIVHLPKNLWVRRQIATKLQKLNRMIKAIPERSQRYGVDRIEGTSSLDHQTRVQDQRESSLFVIDDDLVGIKDARQQLLDWLIEKSEPQSTVISVVGMGGSGKTTLVAQAYKSQLVKRHFDCFAWITVSQTYRVQDLLRSMIKEFYLSNKEAVPMDLSNMNQKELLEMIVNYLQSKRYVVVFDDVWSSELWERIKVALPDEGLGSRVVITTRQENIASSSFGVRSYVHYINPLGRRDAMELFYKKAFSGNGNRCSQEIKEWAEKLVAKCEGLPLAIATLGGVMSSKHHESQWRSIYNSLSSELNNDPGLEVVKSILLLGFNDLSYQLKCCFLYCCLFPEDYLIRRKRLIRLWMAEGFVKKSKGVTPEDVAEGYLMELICRSMLQVVQRNQSGRPKACKMHDLMREVALSISETEKFSAIYDDRETNEGNGARRLSIQTIGRELRSWKGMSQVRSLLVFAVDVISPSMITLPRGFRLLRVLDLEDAPIDQLPDELVDLFSLRYLNLKRTRVKELPKSIGRLWNLQTLDIRDSKIEVLPVGITQLQNLRHLIMYRYNRGHVYDFVYVFGTPAPSDICKLKNLQVLACVEAEADLMKGIRNMTQLKRIGITKLREANEEDLCISIQKMSLLHYLFLMANDEDEYLRTDALSSAPPLLKTLILVGKLEKMPRWFYSLQNLTYLYLHWSRLSEDVLAFIQELPELGKLTLVNACAVEQLHFRTGFRKLTYLDLSNLPELKEIKIGKGVMPDVQKMYLERCMELKMLPHGIENLSNLEELNLSIVPSKLIGRIRGEGSVDRHKVQHIPKINHYYQSRFGISYESLS